SRFGFLFCGAGFFFCFFRFGRFCFGDLGRSALRGRLFGLGGGFLFHGRGGGFFRRFRRRRLFYRLGFLDRRLFRLCRSSLFRRFFRGRSLLGGFCRWF